MREKFAQTIIICLLPLLLCCSQGGSNDPLPSPNPDTTPTPKPDTSSVKKPSIDNPGVTIRDWGNDGNDYGGTAE